MNNLILELTHEQAKHLMSCLIRTNASGKDLDVGEMVEGRIGKYFDESKVVISLDEKYRNKKYKFMVIGYEHFLKDYDGEIVTLTSVIQDPNYKDLNDAFLFNFNYNTINGSTKKEYLMMEEFMDAIRSGSIIEVI